MSVAGDGSAHLIPLERGWAAWRLSALRSAGLPIQRLKIFVGCGDEPDVDAARASRRRAFHDLLADGRFLEALCWQNPEAIDTWAGSAAAALQSGDRPRTSGSRFGNRFAVLTRYAQRYAAKNETIGFFGPVAWARLGGATTGYLGTGDTRTRTAYIEVWAAQAIATAWSAEPSVQPWLPVRLDPAVSVADDGTVVRPYRRPYVLSPDDAAVVDGLLSGRDRMQQLKVAAGESAEAIVEKLSREGVVQLGFRVPICSHPLDELQRQLASLPDAAERVERLDQVRRSCRTAASAVGTAAVREALRAASEALAVAAGQPVLRDRVSAVGGRTPIYLDARRDLDATVGDDLLAELAGPLGILLDSARWLCGQVAEVATEHLLENHRRLAARRQRVTLSELYLLVSELLEPGGGAFGAVVEDFQLRWLEILGSEGAGAGPGGGQLAVQIPLDRARQLADALFPAPSRLWAAARLHSPDLMLRRLPDGALGWVIGELHVALNTLESRFFAAQADDPSELIAAMARDMACGRVVPVYPSSARDVSSRSYPPLSLDPPGHYRYVSFGSDDGHPSGVVSTPATEIAVWERDGELFARSERDGWEAPILECLGEQLSAAAVNLFVLRKPVLHAPRVDLGTVTICRASWQLPLPSIAAASGREDPEGPDLRGRLNALGVPRHVFARVPGDRKPIYVDLAAPPLVDNLARAARRAVCDSTSVVQLVEMLPDPDELWLQLDDGTYTSELRLVIRDPHGAEQASWDWVREQLSSSVDPSSVGG